MAEKSRKSQAEKAAAAKNKSQKHSAAKKKNSVRVNKVADDIPKVDIPVRLISSAICLALFVLFLVIAFVPEGYLVDLIGSLIYGLIGQTAFAVAIPALLYMFIIHAFSGQRPIKMRTICLIGFVATCGAIAQLGMDTTALPSGIGVISELYLGGISGVSSGLLCGGIGLLLRALLGTVLTYILAIIGGILMLLGSMQITIPSIIRAIKERPRPDWDEVAYEEHQEPAAVVVNHIANKRIEYMERRRQLAEQETDRIPAVDIKNDTPKNRARKAKDILSQIDSDVEDPVIASGFGVESNADSEIIPLMQKTVETTPKKMPELILQTETQEDIVPEVLLFYILSHISQRMQKNLQLRLQKRLRLQKQQTSLNTVSRQSIC